MKCNRLWVIGLATASVFGDSPAWVEKSNGNAQILIDVKARFGERHAEALRDAGKILAARLDTEKDPLVRQDLEILLQAERQDVREFEVKNKYFITYAGVLQRIFGGI